MLRIPSELAFDPFIHFRAYRPDFLFCLFHSSSSASTITPHQLSSKFIVRAIKGPGWAGPGVVLALPSIYAGSGLSGLKPSKGLHYVGPYPTLEGQDRTKAGLMALKQENYFFFFNIITKIWVWSSAMSVIERYECNRALSCLALIAKKSLRKHPLSCLISIASEPLRKYRENISHL